ncbi:MAG: lipoate protein ligase C-terminal domain-containing protein [Candidatus Bathyarchaeia archaeon]
MNSFQGRSEIKVPGGKLLRVKCTVDMNIISNIQITGDFFIHPEETIQSLEDELTGVAAEEDTVRRKILEFFRRVECVLIGAGPDDFATAVSMAISPPATN